MKLILILKANTVLKNIGELRGMILDIKIFSNRFYPTYTEITIPTQNLLTVVSKAQNKNQIVKQEVETITFPPDHDTRD